MSSQKRVLSFRRSLFDENILLYPAVLVFISSLFFSFSISSLWRPRSGRLSPSNSFSGNLGRTCRGNESETTWRCSRYQTLHHVDVKSSHNLLVLAVCQHVLRSVVAFFLDLKRHSVPKFILQVLSIAGNELPITPLGEFEVRFRLTSIIDLQG